MRWLLIASVVACNPGSTSRDEIAFETALDFGNVPSGGAAVRQVHVRNTTGQVVRLDRFENAGSDFAFVPAFSPVQLMPYDFVSIDVSFIAPVTPLSEQHHATFTLGWNSSREGSV